MPDTTTPTGRPAIGFNSTRVQWMGVGSSPHKPDAALAVNDLERLDKTTPRPSNRCSRQAGTLGARNPVYHACTLVPV